jgi:hypothetical protein
MPPSIPDSNQRKINSTGLFGFASRYLKNAFGDRSPPSFYSDWSNTRTVYGEVDQT